MGRNEIFIGRHTSTYEIDLKSDNVDFAADPCRSALSSDLSLFFS